MRDCRPGNVLLIEQVDRLSRLTEDDWRKLRGEIDAKQVRIVSLDLPTSWSFAAPTDEFTGRVFQAINGMMLDVLAAAARKDYDDRRRRQAQGPARAKAADLYKGRPEDKARNEAIASMLQAKQTWVQIIAATGCSRTTLQRIAKRMKVAQLTR